MELELTRVDYTLIGVALQNSLKLLPINKFKEQQKIVVGDQNGCLQLISVKKGEIIVHFKTVPGLKITSVQLGGAVGTLADKIFVAYENQVIGYNKKGKVFLSFDTNLTEPIRSMYVTGSDLICCGNHSYTHYKDLKDNGSYLCGDNIVDVAALNPNNTSRVITALACSGRVVRFLEHCRVRQLVEVESVPTVLHVPKNSIGDKLLVGFADGRVILFRINAMITDIKQEVLVPTKDGTSAVTCLDTYDLYGDGKEELIIGHRDGTVEVYTMLLENNEFQLECQEIYSGNFDEMISSVQGGCFGNAGYTEVIVCTYTGKIFGLTTQCINESIGDKKNEIVTDASQRIEKLKAEVESLEEAVSKERARYQMSTQALSSGLSAISLLPINDSVTLSPADATYILSLEIPAPIEHLLIQCDFPLELLDVENNAAIVSYSECDKTEGNHLLATYRCSSSTNRIDLKYRTVEGQYGNLQIYITPNIQPKCCQLKKYWIHPLSLHIIVHKNDESRAMNSLTLKGNFSQGEMHNWISKCIPETPEKPQMEPIVFKNVFVGSFLICIYNKGEAEFKSDNISTISILKDFLTKEATTKHTKIEIFTSINEASIEQLLKLLDPQLKFQVELDKNYKLLQALLELNLKNDEEFKILSDKYKTILKNKDQIEESYKQYSVNSTLIRMHSVIIEAYNDKMKFKGIHGKSKLDQLTEILKNYVFEDLLNFFKDKAED